MSDIEDDEVVSQPKEDWSVKLVPTPVKQPAQCGHCKFLHQTEVNPNVLQRTFECHRFPPQVQAIVSQGQIMMVGQFPPVQLAMWCGEYAQ
jgi:hypothetical protein